MIALAIIIAALWLGGGVFMAWALCRAASMAPPSLDSPVSECEDVKQPVVLAAGFNNPGSAKSA